MELAIDETRAHGEARAGYNQWKTRRAILERNGFALPSTSSVDVNRCWARARTLIRSGLVRSLDIIEAEERACETVRHDRELRKRRELVHTRARELWQVW